MTPPGVVYLLSRIPRLAVRSLLTACVLYGLAKVVDYNINLSWASKLSIVLFCVPFVYIGEYQINELKKRLNARRLGAVYAPVAVGKWPGSLDFVLRMYKRENDVYLGDALSQAHKKAGSSVLNMRLLFQDRISTLEPEHVKIILATDFQKFEKGPQWRHQMRSLLGDGVFNADGNLWKFHRSMTRPFFSKDRISHFEKLSRHADQAISLMKNRLSEGHAVDMQDVFSRFTLDSATEVLFGHCLEILSSGAGLPYSPRVTSGGTGNRVLDKASLFSEAFSKAQAVAAPRTRLGKLWPLAEFWKDKTQIHMETINSFIDPILKEAVSKRKNRPIESQKKEIRDEDTLLDHLINYTEDMKILRDEILNIMIAGRDTTASLLTSAVYALTMYPHFMNRLREEVLRVVGSERCPSYEDLKDMKYLRAFLNETLRLYPPVPFNVRASNKATTLPSKIPGEKPIFVPANTRVTYCVFLMHRREDLWGPDAQEFDPDRFLDSRLHKYLTPNPFIFLPFNAGPRICLGQQFAYNEASFMLVRLLQAFDNFEIAQDAQLEDGLPPASWAKELGSRKSKEKVRIKNHLTMYVPGGLWVRMHEASMIETA